MGKVIQFRPPRPQLRAVPRAPGGNCPKCHHKMNVHITHPNGVISCAARGCPCEMRPTR
ncbi:MAG: hypothetical protein WA005_15870 [Candidatus Binataceae bacterium]